MSYAVVTAIYDGYDTLKPFPTQDVEVETIAVSDEVLPMTDGWDLKVFERHLGMHPNRAAKRPKCTPWEYTAAEHVIWIDASIRVTSPAFVREACAFANPIAQFDHPSRACIYQEARISMGLGKYVGEPLTEQCARYDVDGHPAGWGLWATGIIVRQHTPEVEAFGKAWLAEIDQWSFQDQVSEAPMLREHNLRPTSLPGGYFAGKNPWLGYDGSVRH